MGQRAPGSKGQQAVGAKCRVGSLSQIVSAKPQALAADFECLDEEPEQQPNFEAIDDPAHLLLVCCKCGGNPLEGSIIA